jgi:hypothetical protein
MAAGAFTADFWMLTRENVLSMEKLKPDVQKRALGRWKPYGLRVRSR